MSAFSTTELHGTHFLVDVPPLKPLALQSKTLASGGEPKPVEFNDGTKYFEIKIKTLGATEAAPDVNVIFDDDTAMTFPCGIWTRIKNVPSIRLSYSDGGSAVVEIREF